MNPNRVSELEAAGVDSDGFHEDPDAPVPGAVLPPGRELLPGGNSGAGVEEIVADRPSGVYKRRGGAKPARVVDKSVPKPGAGWVQGADGEELCLSVRKVGCFLLRPDGHKRHRVFNLLTGFQHVTYGEDADIDAEYMRQSESWRLKLNPVKRHGSGWRQTNFQPKVET